MTAQQEKMEMLRKNMGGQETLLHGEKSNRDKSNKYETLKNIKKTLLSPKKLYM